MTRKSQDYPSREVGSVIDDALKAFRRSSSGRRHPAAVTADRLGLDSTKYDFDASERDAIAVVINALRRVSGD